MSDFHKLVITIFKVKPDITDQNYKIQRLQSENKGFDNKLQVSLENFNMSNSSFIELKTISMELLSKVVPLKTKYLKANYSKFMTEEQSKAITLRTK